MMKKQFVIIFVFLLFFISFSGCNQLDQMIESASTPNYIKVVVIADAIVLHRFVFYALDGSYVESDTKMADKSVRFDMIKAGGETHTLYRTTDSGGKTGSASASFELYKEQNIVSKAAAEGLEKDVYPTVSKTLTWDEVNSSKKFGETYSWVVHHEIIGYRIEHQKEE